MTTPKALDKIVDLVLRHKPKPKTTAAEKRAKKTRKIKRRKTRD